MIAISSEFDCFRNKAKNSGLFRKNAGRKAKCGISRTIVGWLTPMQVIHHFFGCGGDVGG